MNREVICFDAVAPARERGLKSLDKMAMKQHVKRRSRKGVWIETLNTVGFSVLLM